MGKRRPLFTRSEWKALKSALNLSDRQAEIANRIIAGDSDRTIAVRLGISPSTVRSHIQSIYRMLGVGDRTSLVVEIFREFRGRR